MHHNRESVRSESEIPVISIIVPTLAAKDRKAMLLRAVRSVFAAAAPNAVKAIVCVNGDRADNESVHEVAAIDGVELHRLPQPSLPAAIAYGRSAVTTPFFGFLDDDDELLPGALDTRLEVLRRHPDRDFVATNGIRRSAAGDVSNLKHLDTMPAAPLAALFEQNWLPSCGALFRTATVETKYFDDLHRYAEWTWLAFRLALDGKRPAVLDVPTYVINDTPSSLSKSLEFRHAYLSLCQRMLTYRPPRAIRTLIGRRMAGVLHDLSGECLKREQLAEATGLHLRSLMLPGGLGYFTYSRHILGAGIRTLVQGGSKWK